MTIIEDIEKDLPTVKWSETTPASQLFSQQGAKSYSGTGSRWTHNVVIWTDEHGERCDGAVVCLTEPKGLIVRYTPSLAQAAAKSVKEALCK